MARFLVVGLLGLIASTAHAQTYVLVGYSCEIASCKASGRGWDIWPIWAPEPYLRVSVFDSSGEQVDFGTTAYCTGTYSARWDCDLATVEEGDRVRVEVWDKDLRYDDLIGKYDFVVTREVLRAGEIRLRFGQVQELLLRFRAGS